MAWYYIWGDGSTPVNVRMGPGYEYDVVASLEWGTKIQATDTVFPSAESGQPGWRQVRYNGSFCCVRNDLLGPELPPYPPKPLTEPFGGD